MMYVSGLHALNLPCKLDTTGDWHPASMDWGNMFIVETSNSIWGDYGIEKERNIPYIGETWAVANHIRACLDMIAAGDFSNTRGMRNDYIGNDKYNDEIFSRVIQLNGRSNLWPKIDRFMENEYLMKWVNYKRRKS